MITIVKSMQQVTGSEIILFGSVCCAMFFILVFLIFKTNRSRKAIIIYLIALLLLFEVCDVIWLAYFFPEGEYVNRGMAPVGPFLIFPLFCIILNTICTIFNYISRRKTLRK